MCKLLLLFEVYAIPPDCETSPRSSSQTMPGPGSKANLTRTNPRQMRQNPANNGQTGQTPLRPTVIDVMPENWERYISFNFQNISTCKDTFFEVIRLGKVLILLLVDNIRNVFLSAHYSIFA